MKDGSSRVTYEGATRDGEYVVVVESASGTRVFFGAREHLAEQHLSGNTSSCAYHVNFAAEGASRGAVFAYPSCNGTVNSRLEVTREGNAAVTKPLTVFVLGGVATGVLATATFPSPEGYYCF